MGAQSFSPPLVDIWSLARLEIVYHVQCKNVFFLVDADDKDLKRAPKVPSVGGDRGCLVSRSSVRKRLIVRQRGFSRLTSPHS